MNCKYCNKYFESDNKRKKYCSNNCKSLDFQKKNPREYKCKCDYCGKEYIAKYKSKNKHTFCSFHCAGKYKNRNGINKRYKCKQCGKEFYQKNKNHFYCSPSCKIQHGIENTKTKIVYCANCGKELVRIRCTKNKDYFCNVKCQGEYNTKTKTEIRKCEICGKEFRCKKSDKLILCSRTCRGKWQSLNRSGKDSPTYKHEITEDMRIKKCKCCGKDMIGTPKSFEVNNYCSRSCLVKDRKKSLTLPHRIVDSFLDENSIEKIDEFQIGRYVCDILISDSKNIIEVNGTYWHSDIRFYEKPERKERELGVIKDRKKKENINKKGYNILYLWEYDINNNFDVCKKLIFEFISKNGILENYHSFNYILDNNDLKLISNIIIPHQDK